MSYRYARVKQKSGTTYKLQCEQIFKFTDFEVFSVSFDFLEPSRFKLVDAIVCFIKEYKEETNITFL